MIVTVIRGAESIRLDLPPTSREVSVRGFMIPVDMLKTVRLDRADATQGCIACQCLSNPMEIAESKGDER